MSATGAKAGSRNIVIQQGASFVFSLTVKTGDPPVVVPLTGATAKMQIRSDKRFPNLLVELSTANGRITIDEPNGTLTLRLGAADTAALDCELFPGRYDLLLTYSDSTVDRLLEGLARLDPASTVA